MDLDQIILNIENGYFNNDTIDYIGINIGNAISSKVYYKKETDPILFMRKKHVDLREALLKCSCFINSIDDHNSQERYAIMLKEMHDDQVEHLLDKLYEHWEYNTSMQNEVKSFAQLPISEKPEHLLSSWHQLELILNNQDIEALKFYFMTREAYSCIEKYNDDKFIKYLEKLNIDLLTVPLRYAKTICNHKYANLRLVGVDYYKDNHNKYKIYLRCNNNDNDLHSIFKEFFKYLNLDEIRQAEVINILNLFSNTLYVDIIAFCIDSTQKLSINLYFACKNKGDSKCI